MNGFGTYYSASGDKYTGQRNNLITFVLKN